MTDEEIEKEAKEYSQGNFYSEQGFLYGYERGFAEGRKEKYLEQNNDGTIRPCEVMKENEELEWQLKEVIEDNDYYQKKNEELENQIEKMKCCGNCKYRNNYNFPTLEEPCKKCLNYSKWELAE